MGRDKALHFVARAVFGVGPDEDKWIIDEATVVAVTPCTSHAPDEIAPGFFAHPGSNAQDDAASICATLSFLVLRFEYQEESCCEGSDADGERDASLLLPCRDSLLVISARAGDEYGDAQGSRDAPRDFQDVPQSVYEETFFFLPEWAVILDVCVYVGG